MSKPFLINGLYAEAIDDAAELPAGATPVPVRPSADHDWDGAAWRPRSLTLIEVQAREKTQVNAAAANRIERTELAQVRVLVALAEGRAAPAAALAKVKKAMLVDEARDTAIAAIDAAATKAAARAVFPAIVWP